MVRRGQEDEGGPGAREVARRGKEGLRGSGGARRSWRGQGQEALGPGSGEHTEGPGGARGQGQ